MFDPDAHQFEFARHQDAVDPFGQSGVAAGKPIGPSDTS